MVEIKNTMAIFKLLPKTNCRKCNAPTCLAFAAAVFQGQRQISDCPFVDSALHQDTYMEKAPLAVREEDMNEKLGRLKAKVAQLDLAQRAAILGGRFSNNRLILKILGKEFAVNQDGRLITHIHVNPWIAIPVFDYLLNAKGVTPTGKWGSLRELKGGQAWYKFFDHRCETPLKKIADRYTDFFYDMVHIFDGKQVEKHYDADIAVVLSPLPKVPILVCYLKPEDGLESDLNLFFDETAIENLSIESIYTISAGLANMFEKIVQRHGVANLNGY
jgi:hypothetical protein